LFAVAAAGAALDHTERAGVDESRLRRLFSDRVLNADDPVRLMGELTLPPEPAPGAFYVDISAEGLSLDRREVRASGGVRLMVPVEDALSRTEFDRIGLDFGSRVRVLVRLGRARSYGNPGSLDFNEFLERSGFDLTGVVKSPLLIERLEGGPAISLSGWLYRARIRAMEAIDARFEPEVAGTLKAMLLGNRYFLDPESADLLRESSTFHIISISGMHVALIAWAMMGGWSSSKRRRAVHIVLVLTALWLYAVMVGLQPPVARATLMISAGLIGPLIFRRAASVNTVALAAFIMLALKPSLVADPGFQLSFVAVLAIVSIAVPLTSRLRQTGEWLPTARTPHPPSVPQALKTISECLFWNEQKFRVSMLGGPVRYALDKSPAACSLPVRIAQPLLRWLAALIITSTAIQAATLPLGVLYFNRIAPVGILTNIVSGTFAAVMMLGAVAASCLGGINQWMASQIESAVASAHYLLVHAASPFIRIPGATFRVAHFEDWRATIYIAYFALVVAISLLIEAWRPVHVASPGRAGPGRVPGRVFRAAPFAAVCGAGLIVCFIIIAVPSSPRGYGRLIIHFLDVGQGDSALIIFPQGATMLVDAGGEIRAGPAESEGSSGEPGAGSFIGEMVVSRFLWSLGLTRIDYAVVTHADRDHIGGFSEVIRNFDVGQAVVASAPAGEVEFDDFAALLARRAVPASLVSGGESFNIQGVAVEVVWPPGDSRAGQMSGNDRSIVIRLVYGSVAVLLTGDIEREGEEALLRTGVDLRADLLKVPHHGSKTSSSDALLDAVRPRSAIISVGERSRFGHPHRAVVDRYLDRGIRVYQTGRDGAVSAQIDGATALITTYKR
jgi:competence protein ComEC